MAGELWGPLRSAAFLLRRAPFDDRFLLGGRHLVERFFVAVGFGATGAGGRGFPQFLQFGFLLLQLRAQGVHLGGLQPQLRDLLRDRDGPPPG